MIGINVLSRLPVILDIFQNGCILYRLTYCMLWKFGSWHLKKNKRERFKMKGLLLHWILFNISVVVLLCYLSMNHKVSLGIGTRGFELLWNSSAKQFIQRNNQFRSTFSHLLTSKETAWNISQHNIFFFLKNILGWLFNYIADFFWIKNLSMVR